MLFGNVYIGGELSLPLTISNTGDLSLVIYGITPASACFTCDFDPADSLILVGESLIVNVTFLPQDPIAYIQTMTIDNNDELLDVGVLGIGIPMSVDDPANRTNPEEYYLAAPYPNPFNPTTAISYQLPANSYVNLAVYDLSGQQVAELVNGTRDAGVYEVTFDASELTSGVYIYRLTADNFNATGKMVLMK